MFAAFFADPWKAKFQASFCGSDIKTENVMLNPKSDELRDETEDNFVKTTEQLVN